MEYFLPGNRNMDDVFEKAYAVCFALDISFSRDELIRMFGWDNDSVDAFISYGKNVGQIAEDSDGMIEIRSFGKEKYLEIEPEFSADAIFPLLLSKRFIWDTKQMDKLSSHNILKGNMPERIVHITEILAKKAFKEKKHSFSLELYRTNAEYCETRHIDHNVSVRVINQLSNLELSLYAISRQTLQVQKRALERIVPERAKLTEAILMLYHGLFLFHLGDPTEGHRIRLQALAILRDFNKGEYEKEINALTTIHYSYSGMVRNTISSYESNMAEMDGSEEYYLNCAYQLTIRFAYFFLGEASKAQVSTELVYQRAIEQKNKDAEMMIQGTLGRAYIFNGNYEKGRELLYKSYNDACDYQHPWGQVYALIGLSKYYLDTNDPKGCYDVYSMCAEVCERYSINFIQGSGFIIDVFKFIEENGYKVKGYDYRELVEKHMVGSHRHVKAVALRHKAKLLIGDGASYDEIIQKYDESIDIFNQLELNNEIAQTQIELAMFLLSIGKKQEAIKNASNALTITSVGTKVEFPKELVSLIGSDFEEEQSVDLNPIKDELTHISNKDIMISRLVTSMERALKAEKAALIQCSGGDTKILFTDNRPYEKVGDGHYEEMLSRVAYCRSKKRVVCISPHSKYASVDFSNDLYSPSMIIGIPFIRNNDVKLVLYLECFYRDNELTEFEEDTLQNFVQSVSQNVTSVLCPHSINYDNLPNLDEGRNDSDNQFYRSKEKQFEEIYRKIDKVAKTSVPVLITGETGVGKEVVAKEVFQKSDFKSNYITVNCGAIPENLIESELFGYEKGSFTGATGRKIGYFEAADGGTIFLDEIGELPLLAQVKLLRVLQEKTITRIGGTQSISVNFRLIAATNKDLTEEVRAGRFREDLFYRLNIIQLEVPPLRQRKNDIIMMSKFFINRFQKEIGREDMFLSDETLLWMLDYAWPGNIRELENTVHRAVLLSEGQEIIIGNTEKRQLQRAKIETLEEVERNYILKVLNLCDGVVSGPKGAATLLGLKRTTLQARMEKLGITKDNL